MGGQASTGKDFVFCKAPSTSFHFFLITLLKRRDRPSPARKEHHTDCELTSRMEQTEASPCPFTCIYLKIASSEGKASIRLVSTARKEEPVKLPSVYLHANGSSRWTSCLQEDERLLPACLFHGRSVCLSNAIGMASVGVVTWTA